MDNDDNDSQSHDRHLASEGNNNFPPVLRPYALSRFDFDDNLHGHLRFDSLVETEVFLGIENSEDNQWIEDFSRGSTGIAFSSSAAESCSISRCNNVWSEAASSESVEMLLKSVGQDEPVQTIIKDSDACDELGCIINQMEPSLTHGDSSLSKVGDDLQPVLQPGEFPGKVCGLKDDVGGDQQLVEDVSQTHEFDTSVDGALEDLKTRNTDLQVTERDETKEHIVINEKLVEASVDESVDIREQEDKCLSGSLVDTVISSVQNTYASSALVDSQDTTNFKNDLIDENVDSSARVNVDLSQEVQSDGENFSGIAVASVTSLAEQHAALDTVSKEDGHAIGNSAGAGEPVDRVLKGNSDLHMVEGCREGSSVESPLQTGISEDIVLSEGKLPGVSSMPFVGDTTHKEHGSEVSNTDSLNSTSLESNMGSTVLIASDTFEKKDLLEGDCHPDVKVLSSKSEISLVVDDNGSKDESEGSRNTSGAEPMKESEECIVTEHIDDYKPDKSASGAANRNTNLSSDCSNTDCGEGGCVPIIKGVDSSSSGTGGRADELASNLGSDVAISGKSIECVLLPSGKDLPAATAAAFDQKGVQVSFAEASCSVMKTSGMAVEKGAPCETGEQSCNNVDQSLSMEDTSMDEGQPGDQILHGVSPEVLKDIHASPVVSDPTVRGTDGAKAQDISKRGSSEASGSVSIQENNQTITNSFPSTSKVLSHDIGQNHPEDSDSKLVTKDICGDVAEHHVDGSVSIQEKNRTLTNSFPSTSKEPSHDADRNHPEESEPKLVANEKICGDVAMHHVDGSMSILENNRTSTNSLPSTSKEPSHHATQNHPEDSDPKLVIKEKNGDHVDGDHAKTHNSSFPSSLSESQTKIHMTESASSSADLDHPSCGSPIVIRTSEQSQSKTGKDGVKGSEGQNASVSGVINREENKEQTIAEDMKGNYASPGDRTFTFEVPPLAVLSKNEPGKSWQLFSTMQRDPISSVVDGTPPTSSLSKMGAKAPHELSPANLPASKSENARVRSKGASERSGSKGTTERRARRIGSKSAGKEATKKGTAAKEMTPGIQPKGSNRTSNASLSSAGTSQLMKPNEMQHCGPIEVFHQPFKDLQQVQLRAQIFVYGALIQGAAPDEACMISAFGGPDGGRTIWENVWRACVDRVHSKKSHLVSPETPLQTHSGAKTSDLSIKQNALQNKVTPSPASRSTSKGTPTTTLSPMIPLSSPLWSIPTPSCDALLPTGIPSSAVMDYQQAHSPLRPPPVRNFVGHNGPWMSQSPFRVPWVPQTSAFDGSTRFPKLPITEAVNLTPIREASIPHSSAMKQVPTVPMAQSGSPNIFAVTPLLDTKKATPTSGQHSADPKPRKRKKSTVSGDPGHIILHSQAESVSDTVLTTYASTPAAITTPATIVSKSPSDKFITSVSADHLEKGEQDLDQRVALSEDTFGKLQDAQKQAEDASAVAAAAVHHSQEIWNQLGKHKNSRLEPDFETELSSAAVTIAAAAAVAKAAAAAAKVASNAALQAKLMADEALVLGGCKNSIPTNAIGSDNVKKLGKATPASILRGEDATTGSNSVIIAAREAARRRVEAASAASKRAENMDAIVKAAELAAEAVSQAGRIVAMGEPFPLTELVEAGPEAYWKVPQASPDPNGSIRKHIDKSGGVECRTSSARNPKEVQVEKREKQSDNYGMSPAFKETARESLEDHSRLAGGILSPAATSGKDKKGQKGRKEAEIAKTKGVSSESEIVFGPPSMISQTEHGKAGQTSKINNLGEGSRVEVLRGGDGLKVAWFLADILDLKDGKAYVSYNELRLEDGDKLREWVELEGEGDQAPRIRAARPMTAIPFEGTRKRRRAVMGDYNWSVGDRVDSWMQDSWWEGVVTEKSQKDEASFTVHFPAQGETSVVKAWLLRPSLMWKNGSWVEWSSSQENNGSSHEGDTPREKRPRIDRHVVEAKGDKLSNSFDLKESWKPDDTKLLGLSDNEKIFNIGKSTSDESKPDSLRTKRTGLKKEGSRVIFGVPKPGKKRKFMDVSKHYDAGQSSKTHETSDSAKFSKFLVPHGSEPHGTKSKIERRDKYKPKVLNSGKLPSVSSRTISKDSSSNTVVSKPRDAAAADVSHSENISGKRNMKEFRSFSSSDGAAKGPFVFSSKAISSGALPKKTPTLSAKSERISKPRLASAAGKLNKIEEEKGFNGNSMKTTSEFEPRRSNRRIQPTSRLLEGLQSSLIISKIPSVSHDRSHKSQNRSTKGNNQG